MRFLVILAVVGAVSGCSQKQVSSDPKPVCSGTHGFHTNNCAWAIFEELQRTNLALERIATALEVRNGSPNPQ